MRIPRRLIFGDVGDVDLYMLPGVDARSVSCRHLKLQQVESTVHLTMSSAVEAIWSNLGFQSATYMAINDYKEDDDQYHHNQNN